MISLIVAAIALIVIVPTGFATFMAGVISIMKSLEEWRKKHK